MSAKLPIVKGENFEIVQELGDTSHVHIRLDNFRGKLLLDGSTLSLSLPYVQLEALLESWGANRDLFETEFLDLITSIDALLSDLDN